MQLQWGSPRPQGCGTGRRESARARKRVRARAANADPGRGRAAQDEDAGGRKRCREEEGGSEGRGPTWADQAPPGGAAPGMASELELLFTADGVREHEFECPVPGCDGTLTISADLCRLGHGAVAACRAPAASAEGAAARASHRCKWCPVTYAFTPAARWGEHLSCCSGSSAPAGACVDVGELQPRLAELQARDAEDCAALEPGKASKGAEGRKPGKEASDVEVLRAQMADGFDENLLEAVAQELTKHRQAILCGEDERDSWWHDKLSELQRETVIRCFFFACGSRSVDWMAFK